MAPKGAVAFSACSSVCRFAHRLVDFPSTGVSVDRGGGYTYVLLIGLHTSALLKTGGTSGA
jgi:hypothetical protein